MLYIQYVSEIILISNQNRTMR